MRKIIESTLVSLDGVIGDPHLWASKFFDAEAEKESLETLLASDAMLMGRKTYEIFAGLWPTLTGAYPDQLNRMRKYVFSSSLQKTSWNNTTVIRGDVVTEAAKLKQQSGANLIIYGHGLLGQTLMRRNLIDELRLWIHPVIVGHGTQLFREGDKTDLSLTATKVRKNGVVVVSYVPASV